MKKYAKIGQKEIYEILVGIHLDFTIPLDGTINLVNLAGILKTSRYQVKKHMDQMKKDGIVELHYVFLPSEDEIYPPYWGYRLTKKGRDTDYFREREKAHAEMVERIFFSKSDIED